MQQGLELYSSHIDVARLKTIHIIVSCRCNIANSIFFPPTLSKTMLTFQQCLRKQLTPQTPSNTWSSFVNLLQWDVKTSLIESILHTSANILTLVIDWSMYHSSLNSNGSMYSTLASPCVVRYEITMPHATLGNQETVSVYHVVKFLSRG